MLFTRQFMSSRHTNVMYLFIFIYSKHNRCDVVALLRCRCDVTAMSLRCRCDVAAMSLQCRFTRFRFEDVTRCRCAILSQSQRRICSHCSFTTLNCDHIQKLKFQIQIITNITYFPLSTRIPKYIINLQLANNFEIFSHTWEWFFDFNYSVSTAVSSDQVFTISGTGYSNAGLHIPTGSCLIFQVRSCDSASVALSSTSDYTGNIYEIFLRGPLDPATGSYTYIKWIARFVDKKFVHF